MFGKGKLEHNFDRLSNEVAGLRNEVDRLRQAVRDSRDNELPKLEGMIRAYVDTYRYGREQLFDSSERNFDSGTDLFDLFRQITELAVGRFHELQKLRVEVMKLRSREAYEKGQQDQKPR